MTKIIPCHKWKCKLILEDFSIFIESQKAIQHNRGMMNETKYRLMQTLPAFDLQDTLISNA